MSLLEEDEFKHGNVDDCDYENGQKTLYIDAICAKLQSRISNSRQLKLGKILLSMFFALFRDIPPFGPVTNFPWISNDTNLTR